MSTVDIDTNTFKPALIIVDLQEDFLPPNGSLAVANGRDTIPIINNLLNLPFHLKIATKDWHPSNHTSFASNHPGTKPYTDFTTIINPSNPSETYKTRLWPPHCVQNTLGSEFPFELNTTQISETILKGQHPDVEMYSAFYDPLKNPRCSDSGLAGQLKDEGITDVYVVGLAADYCVKCTAEDSAKEGFKTFILEEGTRAVDPVDWEKIRSSLEGIKVVSVNGKEVDRVRKLK
ncbi:a989d646-ec67-4469-9dbc-3f3755b89c6b [Sclerotinia trifoliorum]|uniref:nicotinamidase n=1 Tax=Sclerotinia trifoliorum TaxID=28548 RepID=A0A8H2ZLW3_9HELO|nr:a989d646-ec67-4469-9dbc-3f3755b89c6b [Sclerotinia trifoliorum]